MLRYIEVALLGAFIIVFAHGALDTSLNIDNPLVLLLFLFTIGSSVMLGWNFPKIIATIKSKLNSE